MRNVNRILTTTRENLRLINKHGSLILVFPIRVCTCTDICTCTSMYSYVYENEPAHLSATAFSLNQTWHPKPLHSLE